MKLHDCGCGGIPQVSYSMKNDLEFTVVCTACGNQTPTCDSLREAIILWNQFYCRALTLHEVELTV
jgi:hypothetical protein